MDDPVADLLQSQRGFSDGQVGLLNAIYSLPNIVLILVGGVLAGIGFTVPAEKEDDFVGREALLEKYAKGDEESIEQVRHRVARALAEVEAEGERAKWEKRFYQAQLDGFIPAGRINSAAGVQLQATLINCFVQPVGDSISEMVDGRPGIYTALSEAAETMRRGGGVGYDFSSIRPKGAEVKGTRSRASASAGCRASPPSRPSRWSRCSVRAGTLPAPTCAASSRAGAATSRRSWPGPPRRDRGARRPVPRRWRSRPSPTPRRRWPDRPTAPRMPPRTAPRASQALMLGARARAMLQGRLSPSLDDVQALMGPVFRHRMALNFTARADGHTIDGTIERLSGLIA